MMKALLIEDETAAARNLAAVLREVAPGVQIVATLESVAESIEWLRSNPQPDLLFMDIHLADGDSFRIFGAVEVTAPVIFTTAYDRYALEAFKVSSIDYLLKPINADDVRRALEKLRRLTSGERLDYGATGSPTATLRTRRSRPAVSTGRPTRSTRPSKRCRPCFPSAISSAPTGSSSWRAAP